MLGAASTLTPTEEVGPTGGRGLGVGGGSPVGNSVTWD